MRFYDLEELLVYHKKINNKFWKNHVNKLDETYSIYNIFDDKLTYFNAYKMSYNKLIREKNIYNIIEIESNSIGFSCLISDIYVISPKDDNLVLKLNNIELKNSFKWDPKKKMWRCKYFNSPGYLPYSFYMFKTIQSKYSSIKIKYRFLGGYYKKAEEKYEKYGEKIKCGNKTLLFKSGTVFEIN